MSATTIFSANTTITNDATPVKTANPTRTLKLKVGMKGCKQKQKEKSFVQGHARLEKNR